jgi:hypothetical protein
MRRSREEWRRLVGRWERSGQTAAAFAADAGVNVKTLQFWRYALVRAPDTGASAEVKGLVELRSVGWSDQRFEVDLPGGRRLRVPPAFDGDALRRLLAVLETTS